MNVIEELKDIVDKIDKLDIYDSGLSQQLSAVDEKIQDLLHYIENNKINILWCYRMVNQLKQLRIERRKIKNDMEILTKLRENRTKLVSTIDNRRFLLAEVCKKEKSLNTTYKNRQYTEEELQKILKGV